MRIVWRCTAFLLVAGILVIAPESVAAQTPLPEPTDSELTFFHTDAIGSVRAITDETGTVLRRYDYLPDGQETSNEGSGATGNRVRFAGKERDTETGYGSTWLPVDYFGARYYQAQLGRFTSVDPVFTWEENLVDPQRWNRYSYVRNNPLRHVDPDGRALETLWDIGQVIMSARSVLKDPSSMWSWAALGADVVAAVAPGVPAIGSVIKRYYSNRWDQPCGEERLRGNDCSKYLSKDYAK